MAKKLILLSVAFACAPLLLAEADAAKKRPDQFAVCECTCTADKKSGILRPQTKTIKTKVKIEGSEIPGESCDSLNGGGCRISNVQTGTISACSPK